MVRITAKGKTSVMNLLTAILISLLSLVFTTPASASFSLSVIPYEGGVDLNFGKSDSIASLTKEVVFRVSSDSAKQYRITQSLIEPLSNASGVAIPYQHIGASSVAGSSRSGTINVDRDPLRV